MTLGIVVFDVIGVTGFGSALWVSLRTGRQFLNTSSRVFLCMALGVYCFAGFSNVLEHSEITPVFDYFEDYVEIFFIPFFVFFVISMQSWLEMTRRDTVGSRRDQRQEAELLLQQDQITLLLNSTAEAIYGLDIHGNCTFCNPSCLRLLGYREEKELLGRNMHELIHHTWADGSAHQRQACRIAESFTSRQGFHDENQMLWRADGTSFNAEYWCHPMIRDDQVVGAVVTFLDISERKAAAREREKLEGLLRQAQKMEAIGTLAGGISHDFNNILTAILGFGGMVHDMLPAGSEEEQMQQQVMKAARQAKALVGQILDFSRQVELDRRPLRMQYIIKEALKLLRATIPSSIVIRQNINLQCGPVLADPSQIHQIIMNLFTNAYHAMGEEGGTIQITLAPMIIAEGDGSGIAGLLPGRYLRLEVADTGHGIDNVIQEKIFDPYFTTKGPGEGTGLGLAIVHGIVQNYRGHIQVESAVGIGTTFRIFLPQFDGEESAVEGVTEEISLAGTESLLVVDDDEVITRVIHRMLSSLGYAVEIRTSSLEALKALEVQPQKFDLVIIDMLMPQMNGYMLARKITALHREIPIILCTGSSRGLSVEKARTAGIREIVMKPIVKSELGAVVRRVLNSRPPKKSLQLFPALADKEI